MSRHYDSDDYDSDDYEFVDLDSPPELTRGQSIDDSDMDIGELSPVELTRHDSLDFSNFGNFSQHDSTEDDSTLLDSLNVLYPTLEEEKAMIDAEIAELAILDKDGWYHKQNLGAPNRDPKKIKKMVLVINCHGVVCQTCEIMLDSFDPSLGIEIKRNDDNYITLETRQNEKTVSKIVTATCKTEHPITLINFPCAIDSSTMRTDNPRLELDHHEEYVFDTCISKIYTNNLMSKTTSDNLDETLETMVTQKFAPGFQQIFTPYAGFGQTYIKKQTSLLSKIFEVKSNEPDCGSIDLYIYDNSGTHKYTIMAPPKKISQQGDGYIDIIDNETKYNSRVLNSFHELSRYYDNETISISRLKENMSFHSEFQGGDNVRICSTTLHSLLTFMNSFRIFGCDCQQYIIDFSCFSASAKNYDKDTLSPGDRAIVDWIISANTPLMRGEYGGTLTKRVKRTKRVKYSKRTKRSKRAKYSKRAKRSKRKMKLI